MLNKIRNFLYKLMYGRNGSDTICKYSFFVIIFLTLISLFINNSIIRLIIHLSNWILIIYIYFRIFSKNISKRRNENNDFEKRINYLKTRFKQRKNYRFYNCPNCKTHLRVPKGSGKIIITCKNCGHKFERRA